MCLGGGGGRMSAPKREYQNRPVTVLVHRQELITLKTQQKQQRL